MGPVFVSNFVSKIIAFLCCTSHKYLTNRTFISRVKTSQTRMNKGKTRNHNGCGSFCILVGVGGLEPLKCGVKTA